MTYHNRHISLLNLTNDTHICNMWYVDHECVYRTTQKLYVISQVGASVKDTFSKSIYLSLLAELFHKVWFKHILLVNTKGSGVAKLPRKPSPDSWGQSIVFQYNSIHDYIKIWVKVAFFLFFFFLFEVCVCWLGVGGWGVGVTSRLRVWHREAYV